MKRRSFAGSAKCAAPAPTVWTVWTNPSEWPGGVIDAAKVDGEFVVGARITVKVQGGPPTTSTVTRLDAPKMWVSVSSFPGLTITYEHAIEVAGDGTVLTERLLMTGILSGAAGRLMGNRLNETIAKSTERIARLAEARLPR